MLCAYAHRSFYTVVPPYSHKTLFCPPLINFLDEGLAPINMQTTTHMLSIVDSCIAAKPSIKGIMESPSTSENDVPFN